MVLGLYAVAVCLFGGARGLAIATPGAVLCPLAFVVLLLFAGGRLESARPLWQRGERWGKAVASAAAHPPADDDEQAPRAEDKEPKARRSEEKRRDYKRTSRRVEEEEEESTRPADASTERPKTGQPQDGDRPKRPAPKAPESEVERLEKRLKDREQRVAAARALAKMGKRGRLAARSLCQAIVEETGETRTILLETLEKIHPDLHRHVVPLCVDENSYNHMAASRGIRALEKDGIGGLPILLAHARWAAGESDGPYRLFAGQWQNENMLSEDLRSLASLAPTDSDVIKLLSKMVTWPDPENRQYYRGRGVRPLAIELLRTIGIKHDKLRKELVPALVRGLKDMRSERVFRERTTMLAAIRALGDFGPDAKEAVPALKKEKLNPDQNVRDTVTSALAKIEKTDKDED
jgi:hypothetical protein